MSNLEAILGPLFPVSFVALLALERFLPGAPMPTVRGWTLKGIAFYGMATVMNVTLPSAIGGAIAPYAPLDLTHLPFVAGVAVTLLASTFVDYWTHRFMHRFDAVWRWTHQLHHSAERVDLAGFSYTHPFELALAVTLASIVGSALGIAPDAAMLAGFLTYLMGLLQHLDVNTPVWLGYLVQRPEQHRVHHTRDVHAYNYGLPLWDLLFGTWRNPATVEAVYGFWDGASDRVGALLLGRDVSAPPPGTDAAHTA